MSDFEDREEEPAIHGAYGFTNDKGQIETSHYTNDNLSQGYPSETARWDSKYPSVESFRKSSGFDGARGMDGSVHEVKLDNQPFTRERYDQITALKNSTIEEPKVAAPVMKLKSLSSF